MKKTAAIVGLVISLLVPAQAQAAQTAFMGGPLTNLEPSGTTIHIALSNFPKLGGLYIQECVESTVGVRPTLCNAAVQLWISTANGASFLPTADILFKPTATFNAGTTPIDCRTSKCGAFLRYDHTVPGNLSEDQFIPLTFKAGSGTSAKPVDEISATINGVALSSRVPTKIAYRQLAVLAASAKTGAGLTYASLAPACALKSMSITALKGSGYCDIAITSPGNLEFAAVTAHFPLELTLGVQTISSISMSSSKRSVLPKKTNFGELITYVSNGSCTVTKNIIKASKGTCTLDATAPGLAGLYQPLTTRVVTTVK
jgi:hypothetical protein